MDSGHREKSGIRLFMFTEHCSGFDICHLHFRAQDFVNMKGGIHILRSDVVPSIFGENHNFCAKRRRLQSETTNIPCESCIKLTQSLLSAEERIEVLSKRCNEQTKELHSIKKELERLTANSRDEQPTWLHRLVVPVCPDFFFLVFVKLHKIWEICEFCCCSFINKCSRCAAQRLFHFHRFLQYNLAILK